MFTHPVHTISAEIKQAHCDRLLPGDLLVQELEGPDMLQMLKSWLKSDRP